MATEPTLKSCPRCQDADVCTLSDPECERSVLRYFPECQNCGLTTTQRFHSREAAAAWWNERPFEQDKAACAHAAERDYDPGLLNDYGGGNVQWWQDYIRAEVERCNGYWRSVFAATEQATPEPIHATECQGCDDPGFGCGDCEPTHAAEDRPPKQHVPLCVLKHGTEFCGDHARDICVAVELVGDETVSALVERVLPERDGHDYISIRKVIAPEDQP